MRIPRGFSYAGVHAGIKAARKDLALVASEVPCTAAGCFTQNAARAAPVRDAAGRLPARDVRAIVINSGNANALTGPDGVADARAVCAAVAAQLGVPAGAVLAASTGVIGVRLPVHKLVAAAPALVAAKSDAIELAAEAIFTTDTHVKLASRTLSLGGVEVRVAAFAKGSGMVAPELATVLAFVTTDAAIDEAVLGKALLAAMPDSFGSLTIDGETSTNDAVFALANGLAHNPRIDAETHPGFAALTTAFTDVCVELARAVAEDGEGATKVLEVTVTGAADATIARDLARAVAGSMLVKAAVFGADPNWGRVLAALGARVGARRYELDPTAARVTLQGVVVYDGAPLGVDPVALRARMRAPLVTIAIHVGDGPGHATGLGCDLSYDYVKINADYTSLITASADGTVAKDDRLANYTPGFKRALLVEALSYIARFTGTRAVIKVGGATLVKDALKASFAGDVNLLQSAGLLPIVVHGSGPEIARTLRQLGGRPGETIDGIRINDAGDAKVVEMVLSGRINTDLVTLLNRRSFRAVGLSGKDAGLLLARERGGGDGRDRSMAGEITRVNHELVEVLLEKSYVPVISPVGLGEDGEGYSLDADEVAAEVAIALRAEKLIFLADGAGILENGELVSEMGASALAKKLEDGSLTGGMIPKARSILRAIEGGVARVHLLDGRTPHSVIAELFTDRGVGTLIRKD